MKHTGSRFIPFYVNLIDGVYIVFDTRGSCPTNPGKTIKHKKILKRVNPSTNVKEVVIGFTQSEACAVATFLNGAS